MLYLITYLKTRFSKLFAPADLNRMYVLEFPQGHIFGGTRLDFLYCLKAYIPLFHGLLTFCFIVIPTVIYSYNRVRDMVKTYCVSMTGRGLEWYASVLNKFAQLPFNIYNFMRNLVDLTKTGLSLNISRLDIALDDKPDDKRNGILDLDVIIQKAEKQEYISMSRTKNKIREIVQYKGDNITGRTIYFGSRKSTSYIRIYDKAAEQDVAGHWIRVEFKFKQETAMRIVNAMCITGNGFPEYFSEVAKVL